MDTYEALLVLADIRGYTDFMRLHRLNLAHSQDITARLLTALVDAVPEMNLIEIEGDAAFLCLPRARSGRRAGDHSVTELALLMHQAFHGRQQWMVARNMCSCEACRQIGTLHVKFVAHVGEVATQSVHGKTKLVGVDVIAAHRLLKNSVPVSEYLLMSDSLFAQSDPPLRSRGVRLDEELEGLGTMTTYFVDLAPIALEPRVLAEPTRTERITETLGVVARCFPRVVGLRRLRAPPRQPAA